MTSARIREQVKMSITMALEEIRARRVTGKTLERLSKARYKIDNVLVDLALMSAARGLKEERLADAINKLLEARHVLAEGRFRVNCGNLAGKMVETGMGEIRCATCLGIDENHKFVMRRLK